MEPETTTQEEESSCAATPVEATQPGASPASAGESPAAPGAAPVPAVPASTAAPAAGKPAEDRYVYEQCTIVLVVQVRPQTGTGQPRQVVLSVQNGVGNTQDFPIYRVLTEADLGGPFPPAIVELLEQLRQELPIRKAQQAAHQAQQKAAASSSTHKATTGPTGKAGKAAASTPLATPPAAPPPVPTTDTPIPKGELTMGGLFDEA
jgi:hypothetical protein